MAKAIEVDGLIFRYSQKEMLHSIRFGIEEKAILYSSHVLDVVERVCDRVLIIHQGDLIAGNTLEALRNQTHGSTLEEIFRQLTHPADTAPAIAQALEVMKL
jgi:ABC-2 type transport system ATP-binding protein